MLIRLKDMKMVDATNRVDDAFKAMDRGVLSIFFTAGYPRRDDTQPILHALSKSDVDLVEIGIPFSDPIADGKVIQHSNQAALENGMTLVRLFQQLREMRKEVDIPIILMGYLNPIFHYGFENFCASCEDVGVDGMIIPDLPLHEVANGYGEIAGNHNLTNSLIISPKSTSERIKKIDGLSTGFNNQLSSSARTLVEFCLSISGIQYDPMFDVHQKKPLPVSYVSQTLCHQHQKSWLPAPWVLHNP